MTAPIRDPEGRGPEEVAREGVADADVDAFLALLAAQRSPRTVDAYRRDLEDADRFFRGAGFSPRIAMESSSNEMIKQSVIAGMGLALISRHTVSLEAALGLLVPLAIEDASLMRSWFVVQRRTLPLLPVQDRLRGFLVEQGHAVIDAIGHDHAALSPLGTTLARMKRG